MAASPAAPGPFRRKSLERLATPERLDELLQLVERRSWIPLAALSALVALLIAWSVAGWIPITVTGTGILVHPHQVVELQSPGSGRIVELRLAVGDHVQAGQELGRIALPELEGELEQQRAKAGELLAAARPAEPLSAGAAARGADHLAISRDNAERLREEALRTIAKERAMLRDQLGRAQQLSGKRERILEKYNDPGHGEIVAEQERLDVEERELDSRVRVSALESRLAELDTRELEVNDQYLARLRQLTDLTIDLADVRREIEGLELRLAEEGRLVSERSGLVLEVSAAPGGLVQRGDRLGAISADRPGNDLVGLVYFTVRDGKRIEPGNPIQITPDTAERERHGGIRGEVTRVSPYPITLAEAQNMVGNRDLAESLIRDGRRIQVEARLLRDPGEGGRLLWTSSRGEAIEVSPGLTATARVTVEERRPIGFLLPILRKSTGLE